MSQAATPESILIADCGAVATKVALVDRVGSEYRLIGVTRTITTVEPPGSDIMLGVVRAISQLETMTGRALLNDQGELITPEAETGEGVDALVAVTSAALPLHSAVVGLSRDLSVASACRALASTYATVDTTIAVDEETGRWGTTAQDGSTGGPSASVEGLAASHPDVIVMVGGVDGGAITPLLELANIIASIGSAMEEGARPLVLFAGNREARAQVAERIGSTLEFRAVDNVLPMLDHENPAALQNELEAIFYERKVKTIPGFAKLSAWSARPIVHTLQSYARVAQFLARRYAFLVQALDFGGATLGWIRADAAKTTRALLPDIGMAYGLDRLVDRIGLDRLARWLPTSISLDDATAWWLNQSLRPWTTPIRPEERIVLNAAAREAMALGIESQRSSRHQEADLVLLSGAPIARGGKPSALLLMALDALDICGIFSIAADITGIVPALGALAAVNAEAAAQVLERDGLVTLGTVIVPNLSPYLAEGNVLQASVTTPKGGQIQVQVAPGSLELIPLGTGEKAQVEIRPARGVDLGVPLTKGVFRREIEGGIVGLVIDARGRPLPFTGTLDQQRERTQEWLWEVGA
ncbi:MAG: glutamate mutase L [Anaerolineae bacterium]